MLDIDNQERFTRLWTEAQPSVSAYVRSVVRDHHAAIDIVQTTALVLLRKFEQWDRSRPFLPWALGAAKFEILGHWRDEGRCRIVFDEALLDQITQSWPDAMGEIGGEQAALGECLEQLAPHARRIVRLRYFDNLKMQQVAQTVGSTSGAVRISLMRIREQLQACVERRLRLTGDGV